MLSRALLLMLLLLTALLGLESVDISAFLHYAIEQRSRDLLADRALLRWSDAVLLGHHEVCQQLTETQHCNPQLPTTNSNETNTMGMGEITSKTSERRCVTVEL